MPKLVLRAVTAVVCCLLLAGCGGAGQESPTQSPEPVAAAVPGAGFNLTLPGEILAGRQTSDEVLSCAGSEFLPEYAQRVAEEAGGARFSPQWTAADAQQADLAIAVYRLNLPSPGGLKFLNLSWGTAPGANSRAWVALSDWQAGCWHWLTQPAETRVALGSSGAGQWCNASGDMLIAVVMTGTQDAVLGELAAVPNTPPAAELSADRTVGGRPLTVSFDAAGSFDLEGPIVKYEWDWAGNGNGPWDADSGTSPLASHVYTALGSWTAWVRVTDGSGDSSMASCAVTVVDGTDVWRMFGHDRSNSRRSAFTGHASAALQWNFKTTGGEPGFFDYTDAAFAADGTIYIGCGPDLLALYPGGSVKWSADGSKPEARPVLGPDGTIYVGCDDKVFAAYNPNGTLKWSKVLAGWISRPPVVCQDGSVVAVADNGQMYSFLPDGTLDWDVMLGGGMGPAPAEGADGTVYASCGNNLYAVNSAGMVVWSDYVSGGASGPVIAADGTLYYCNGGALHAVDPAGEPLWTYNCGFGGVSLPVIGGNGDIIFNYYEGVFTTYAVHPDGNLAWSHAGSGNTAAPTVAADGTIYSGSNGNGLYAFNPNGSVKWHYASTGDLRNTPMVSPAGLVVTQETIGVSYLLVAVDAEGELAWQLGGGGWVRSSPAQDEDGTIYFGSHDKYLYAVDAAGKMKWSFETGDWITSSPAVAADGTVYFGGWDHRFYALNSDGSLKWSYQAAGPFRDSSPVIDSQGTVYAGCGDGQLYAFDDTGKKWAVSVGVLDSSPALGPLGTVYIGSHDGSLYAVNPNGTVKWSYPTGGDISGGPAVGSDGTVYFGSYDRNVYALDPEGSLDWSYTCGSTGSSWISSTPAIAADGTVYVTCHDGNVFALDTAGELKWQYPAGGAFWGSPAVDGGGTIFAMNQDGVLFAISASGGLKWQYETNGQSYSSPAIGIGGTVLVGSDDGKLHAIGPGSL